MKPTLILNFWSSCLYLLRAGIVVTCYQAWFFFFSAGQSSQGFVLRKHYTNGDSSHPLSYSLASASEAAAAKTIKDEEVAQQKKAFAASSEDLSSALRTSVLEGEN